MIAGTPTTGGTSNFTVQLTAGSQSVTKALSITVGVPTVVIWPSNPVPAIVDGGADNPVELGVKFRSDTAGFVTGIRFYKGAANSGTHVGNLWSSAGAKLASVTFTGETASGWQQMNFATPVAIQANTVYVASYFVPNGHYSGNLNYFTGQGVDNAPLHALATGVSGGNGVYGYGATSTFPTNTYQALNYWVDVMFNPQAPPTLTSIAVTPANGTLTIGGTQQFTATGTYSDSSTLDVSNQVTWASSTPASATISGAGLATGVGSGTTTHHRHAGLGGREHGSHGLGRAACHQHHGAAGRIPRRGLLDDAVGQRRHATVHVVDRERHAAHRAGARGGHRRDLRDAAGNRHLELHRQGRGGRAERHQGTLHHGERRDDLAEQSGPGDRRRR